MLEDQRGATMATMQPDHQIGPHSQRPQTLGRDHSCNEALWEAREACQWALEAAHFLELDIERLNKEAGGPRH